MHVGRVSLGRRSANGNVEIKTKNGTLLRDLVTNSEISI